MVGLDNQKLQRLTSLVTEFGCGLRDDREKDPVLAKVARPRMRTSQMTVETLVVEEVVDCCPWLLCLLVVVG